MQVVGMRVAVSIAAVAAVIAVLSAGSAAGATGRTGSAAAGGAAVHMHAVKAGTFSFQGLSGSSSGNHPQAPPHQPMNKTLRHTTAAKVPQIPGTSIATGTGGATGFNGLDAYQQATAGTGQYAGTQFDVTPPDQGLCVGSGAASGYVVEPVNVATRVYSTSGTPLTAAVPLNQFAGLAPEAVPGPNNTFTFGPFLSDPRCYYDPGTGHWFMSFLEIALNPTTGAFGNTSAEYIAVSQTSDPTGTWNIYSFPTTDDGTNGAPSDPGCPCFGDQPLLGADANGVYITTNEYSISGTAFNGAQMYLMSKTVLESGASSIPVTQLQPGLDSSVTNALGGVAFTIQPATSPNGVYASAAGGTEYFQSALDFGAAPALGTRADRIAVWNLTNTLSLNSTTPNVALHVVVLPSEEYTQPPNATQAPGTLVLNKSLPLVATNDDRMNQVVYADGHLWSGLNTAVTTPQGPTLSGIAWFATTPSTASDGTLSATLAGQGYLGINKEDVMFPSIGVTPAGKAVMAFEVAGPDYHPSGAWAPVSLSSGAGPIHIIAAGMDPIDDFSSLKAFGGHGVDRYGDYTAAVSDPSGTVWMGAEYISGIERTQFANWSTFVSHVTP